MLPSVLQPKYKFNMIRIGSKNDGGYLIEKNSLNTSQCLVSFGLYNNWDFERDFLKLSKSVEDIHAYDDVMGTKFLLKKLIIDSISRPSLLYLHRLFKNFYNVIDFNLFAKNKKINLNKIYLGSSHINTNKIYTLESIYKDKNLKNKNFFLKIDIEGSEYRLLNDIIKYKKNITGLIIEFHDVDLHLDKITNFIKDFGQHIAHIHSNNYGRIVKNGDPTVIEVTFTNSSPSSNLKETFLPHEFDKPNNPLKKEIPIIFKNGIPKFERYLFKIAIFSMHPIPYQVPFFDELTKVNNNTQIYYLDSLGSENYYNPYFKNNIEIDNSFLNHHKYFFLKNLSKKNITGFFSRINLGIFKIFFTKEIDYVVVNGYQTFSSWFLFCLSFIFYKKNFVFKGETTRLKRSLYKNFIIKLFLSRFKYYIYSCHGNFLFFKSLGINQKSMIHVPSSVNYDYFLKYYRDNVKNIDVFKKKYKIISNHKTIVFVSKFIKRKNPLELLKAVKSINDQDIQILFVGDGPLKNDIINYAKLYKINISFTGFLKQSELGSAYMVADLYVNTSIYDASPKTINECLCFNIPMVVSDVAGQSSDIIHENINGFVYKEGDVDSLSMKIKLAFNLDKQLISKKNKILIEKTHAKLGAKNFLNKIS